MTIKLDLSHPTFALKEQIQDISGSYLKQVGISYFQYLRCYYDGAISLLTNDTRLFEEFQHIENKPAVYSSFDNRFENKHSYWFLWDEELPDFPVRLAREKFGICHGLTCVRRSKDYYDMIGFALSEMLNTCETLKEVAKLLNISHRTIETYLNRLKLRTGLSTRKELLSLINCQ